MFSNRDDAEMRKLIAFYIICTSIYFPLIFLVLYCSDEMYSVGKYDFKFFLMIIALAEVAKYMVGTWYWNSNHLNLMKKNEDVTQIFVRNVFTKPRLKEGCKNIFTICSMVIVYYIFTVLYGAEILDKHEETLMFSVLLSILTILPSCVNLGSSSVILILLGCKARDRLESLMYQNFYLTLFGAWLGAFVIPLDWDRPWQQWPISCSYGAMLGFISSHVLMAFQVRGIALKKKK